MRAAAERPLSDTSPLFDGVALALLVACHHRGPLTLNEAGRLLPGQRFDAIVAERLVSAGLLVALGDRFAITQAGREHLDHVVLEIARELAPDDPGYVARYRRAEPTLPFDANTVWAEAVCVNVRVEPTALRPLVPAVFDLDLYAGSGFVTLTASRLKGFGVGRLPAPLRVSFYQATYRAHVTFRDFRGRVMRGCYFLRSETNFGPMSLAANLLPEFKAHHCSTYPIVMLRQDGHFVLSVDTGHDRGGAVVLVLDLEHPLDRMPAASIFPSIHSAYAFLVDFYDAFSYDPHSGEVYVLRIERGDWRIQVVEPVDYFLGFISDGPFPPGAARLDSVFYFTDVAYRWLPLLKERISGAR